MRRMARVALGCALVLLICAHAAGVAGAPQGKAVKAQGHVDEHANMIKQMDGMIGKMESTLENVRAALKEKEVELEEAAGLREKDIERLNAEKKELQSMFGRTQKQVDELHASVRKLEEDRARTAADLGKERAAKANVARQLSNAQAEFMELRMQLERSSLSSLWLVAAGEMADEIGDFLESPRTAEFLKKSAEKLTEITIEGYGIVQETIGAKKYGFFVRTMLSLFTVMVPVYVTWSLLSRAGSVLSTRQYVIIVQVVFATFCLTLFAAAIMLQADPVAVLQTSQHDNGFTVTMMLVIVAGAVVPFNLLLYFRAVLSAASAQERLSYGIQVAAFLTLVFVWRNLFWIPLMKPSLVYVPPHPTFYAGFACIFLTMMFLTVKAKAVSANESVATDVDNIISGIENSVRDLQSGSSGNTWSKREN
ncbi:hypothetical protein FVE85_3931 [Porphyridium purpureum]|uniref:Uncharacterized protein n=1 Tax=Porphyridium purpureum TaxID=35688 RepID=A0A5J4YRM8_PORPP|nr:hypothetical protein FVE85_3931 [Porphyridium purpureum]|eukprot:POR1945..scf229_5